jgi:hypothetical protein
MKEEGRAREKGKEGEIRRGFKFNIKSFVETSLTN